MFSKTSVMITVPLEENVKQDSESQSPVKINSIQLCLYLEIACFELETAKIVAYTKQTDNYVDNQYVNYLLKDKLK